MNGYDENRRRFLTKIGLTLGVSLTGTVMQGENVPASDAFAISTEQMAFMINYERWMDDFIEVINASANIDAK